MKEWYNQDKGEWGYGAWQNEPDKAYWVDEDTGLNCLIVRNRGGALCGYVGVPKGHRLYEVEYNDAETPSGDWLDCHGGLTFSDKNSKCEDETKYVCVSDINVDVWWLGFDCAHLGDVSPKWDHEFRDYDSMYRDIGYVKYAVENLASQMGN